jgi:hypothetical protein
VASSASEKEIRQAYRRLALKYHPDVNKKVNAYLSSVCQSCCFFLVRPNSMIFIWRRRTEQLWNGMHLSSWDCATWRPFHTMEWSSPCPLCWVRH